MPSQKQESEARVTEMLLSEYICKEITEFQCKTLDIFPQCCTFYSCIIALLIQMSPGQVWSTSSSGAYIIKLLAERHARAYETSGMTGCVDTDKDESESMTLV